MDKSQIPHQNGEKEWKYYCTLLIDNKSTQRSNVFIQFNCNCHHSRLLCSQIVREL